MVLPPSEFKGQYSPRVLDVFLVFFVIEINKILRKYTISKSKY